MAISDCLGTVKLLINISGRKAWGDQIVDGTHIVLNCDFIIFLGVCRQFLGQSESRLRLYGLVCTSYSTLCELSFRHRKKSGNTKPKTVLGLVKDQHSGDLTC